MESSIRLRVMRALGAEILGQILNLGIRLVLVPLFVSSWGARVYGEWLILTATAAWFGIGDFGGQLYFVNRMTAAWAGERRDEFQQVLSTGLSFFFVSSGVMLAGIALGLAWPPLLPWLGFQASGIADARLVLLIMAAGFLVSLPLGLLLGVYRAIGAQATSVMYGNLLLLIQFLGSAVALRAGAGMTVLAALTVVPELAVAVLAWSDLRRRLPASVELFSVHRISRSVVRESISPSLHFLGIQLAMAVQIQGSVIAIAKSLGPVNVAIFSTMRTVSNVVPRFLGMLSHSVWPEFTRLESLGDNEKLSYLFRSVLFVSLLGGISYLVIVENFGETLFNRWLNHSLAYNSAAMFLMGCFAIFTTLWTFGGNLLMATNQHEAYARLQLPVNVIAIALCYAGAVRYALSGAVIGLILGQSFLMLGIVSVLLKNKGWGVNAASLFSLSIATILLLPLCLNPWSGLLGVVVVAALAMRQLGRRAFPIGKLARQS